ncbi:MAG: transglycosylase SLT domain-containing protein [Hyphomicrobiales bacterium]|nr:transglycosylase SLT domain-containing protein [Hyphomicrobiales bacterium]
MKFSRIAPVFLLSLALAPLPWGAGGPAAAPASHGQHLGNTRDICAQAAAREARDRQIPPRLLQAVALAESGRWDDGKQASFAWPWTVTAGGDGQFFPSRTAAVAHVRALRARGVRNIDVGCMQINLLHHPDAFPSLEQAFDPAANAAYAADYLVSLHDRTGSWIEAAGAYHSTTPRFNARYKAKVAALWDGLKRAPAANMMAADDAGAEPDDAPRFVVPPIDHDRTAQLNARLRAQRAQAEAPAADEPGADDTQADATTAVLARLDRWRQRRVGDLDGEHRRIVGQADRMLMRAKRGLRDAAAEAAFATKRRQQVKAWKLLRPPS